MVAKIAFTGRCY